MDCLKYIEEALPNTIEVVEESKDQHLLDIFLSFLLLVHVSTRISTALWSSNVGTIKSTVSPHIQHAQKQDISLNQLSGAFLKELLCASGHFGMIEKKVCVIVAAQTVLATAVTIGTVSRDAALLQRSGG